LGLSTTCPATIDDASSHVKSAPATTRPAAQITEKATDRSSSFDRPTKASSDTAVGRGVGAGAARGDDGAALRAALPWGAALGVAVGVDDGDALGDADGDANGDADGDAEGVEDGDADGVEDGAALGRNDGAALGRNDGAADGRGAPSPLDGATQHVVENVSPQYWSTAAHPSPFKMSLYS